ncbi:MAG: glycosyltransferase [Proteobacteria bacterium]|nr:glycosyltransferase [Pseudomonadota bacterium]
MKSIAVLYLARAAEGLERFEKFAESYRKYEAGQAHDLIIIYKGDFTKDEKEKTKEIFREIPHISFSIQDEGFDIHSYLHVAEHIKYKYICLFNTFTEIVSPNWLKKLYVHLNKPNVGMVGVTASYESIFSSQKILNHVLWLFFKKGIWPNKELTRQFRWILCISLKIPKRGHNLNLNVLRIIILLRHLIFRIHNIWRMLTSNHNFIERFVTWVRSIKMDKWRFSIFLPFQKYDHPSLTAAFEETWNILKNDGNLLSYVKNFPPFPNPHIRSNGFMLSREFLLEFNGLEKTKIACCEFESGWNGITNRILKKGLSILLVGADGIAYSPEEWPKSQTFRLGKQQNLIATDNQISNYTFYSQPERDLHTYLAWGDYLGHSLQTIVRLGHKLNKRECLRNSINIPKVSVVIPTHNRLRLLKDAIYSVLQQSHPDWELIIFDNGSQEPIKEYIESLSDNRIRLERSEKFLSVTDSWNQAIDYATGDYIIFLGDDDGLAPSYFEKVHKLINDFSEPDFIYSGLYVFMHPGVHPLYLEGSLEIVKNGFFFRGKNHPCLLSKNEARKAWEGSINFQRNFTYNMQAFTFKRSFLEKIRNEGKIFHSPFPDYYLANVAMAKGERIVISPEALAIQGISTESFGYTLFNGLEQRGSELLNTNFNNDLVFKEYEKKLIPGELYQAKYIITMGHVAKKIPQNINTAYGINRYRRHQIFFNISENHMGWLWKTDGGRRLWRSLTTREKIWTASMTLVYFQICYLTSMKLFKSIRLPLPERYQRISRIKSFENIEKQSKSMISLGEVCMKIALKIMRSRVSNTKFQEIKCRISTGTFSVLPEVFERLKNT